MKVSYTIEPNPDGKTFHLHKWVDGFHVDHVRLTKSKIDSLFED